MDLLPGVEIYIPPEAEVKRVTLHSFSTSVRRKMGLSAGLEAFPESPLCIWICPALFQRKGQKEEPRARARQQVLNMLGSSRVACPSLTKGYGQCRMTFVTSHSTAYRLLKETLPRGPKTQLCSSLTLSLGVLSETEQDGIIIHQGRVYLSVKKTTKAPGTQRSAADPSTSTSSSTSHVTPVIPSTRKRKLGSLYEAPEEPQHRPSACGAPRASQRVTQSQQGASVMAAQSQGGASVMTAQSQGGDSVRAAQSQGGASVVAAQRHGGGGVMASQSQGGGGVMAAQSQVASVDQKPAEESGDYGLSLAPYRVQQSHTESGGPSALLARHSLGPSQPDIDFEELASRERIALMKAKLQQSGPVCTDP